MTSFQNLHQPPGREIIVNSQKYLYFGGTAYLGLLNNPDYLSLYQEGLAIYGLNNGTSRCNNVQLGIYQEVEDKLAKRFGYASAAVFSSGYLAAQAAVRSLKGCREVMYAPGSHPALWMDQNPTVAMDFKIWLTESISHINHSDQSDFLLIANSMDNLSPAFFDFSSLIHVSKNKNVLLVLDDSHGLAVVQKDGVSAALDSINKLPNMEVVVVASMAKGLGTDAGVVLGSEDIINQIKAHPIFTGASPASPAAMYALLHGDSIYDEAFEALHSNINYFSSNLAGESNLRYVDNFPVFTSLSSSFNSYLSHCNILISSFAYPLSTSPLLNRVVLSALHHKTDLDYLLDKCVLKNK